MKTNEELQELKQEFQTLNKKLKELSEEELTQVTGGEVIFDIPTGGQGGNKYEQGLYFIKEDPDHNQFSMK